VKIAGQLIASAEERQIVDEGPMLLIEARGDRGEDEGVLGLDLGERDRCSRAEGDLLRARVRPNGALGELDLELAALLLHSDLKLVFSDEPDSLRIAVLVGLGLERPFARPLGFVRAGGRRLRWRQRRRSGRGWGGGVGQSVGCLFTLGREMRSCGPGIGPEAGLPQYADDRHTAHERQREPARARRPGDRTHLLLRCPLGEDDR
jgi:hypothetical protein